MEFSIQTLVVVVMFVFFAGRMVLLFRNQRRRSKSFKGTRNRRGRAHGRCSIRYPNGDAYDGDFYDGVRHGKGIYYYRTGGTYEGDFRNGQMHGTGVETVPPRAHLNETNPTVYEGSFHTGQREGFGKLTSASGSTYAGMWHRGRRHGRGKSRSADSMYDGTWMDSRRHGLGFERRFPSKSDPAPEHCSATTAQKSGEPTTPKSKRKFGRRTLWKSASSSASGDAPKSAEASPHSNSSEVDAPSEAEAAQPQPLRETRVYGEWQKGELVRTFESKAEAARERGDAYKFLLDTPKVEEEAAASQSANGKSLPNLPAGASISSAMSRPGGNSGDSAEATTDASARNPGRRGKLKNLMQSRPNKKKKK